MVHAVTSVDWQNILKLLKLLMLTMLSDGRVYEREADAFINASLNFRSNMDVTGFQTRQMTMDWYIRHRRELIDIQTVETFESDLLAVIDSLDTLPNKKPLLHTLKNLSVREGERTQPDISVVSTLKERWG